MSIFQCEQKIDILMPIVVRYYIRTQPKHKIYARRWMQYKTNEQNQQTQSKYISNRRTTTRCNTAMKHFIRYTCLHGPVNLDFLVFPLCTRRLLLGVVLTLCNNNNVKTELCSTRIYAIIGYEGCSHLSIANIFLVHTLAHSHTHTHIHTHIHT